MTMPRHFAPLALATILCLPAAAFAQTPSPVAPTPPPGATAPATPAPGAAGGMEARVEQRINQLHAQLRITAAEQKDWDQFAQVMRTNAQDMDAALQQRTQQFSTMTALQNMQSYDKLAQMHADHVQKLTSAFETLYNSLPAAQKQAADQAFRTNATNQHAMGSSTTHTE
jgi:periplasmic protein CpxP/Spy